MRDRTNNDSYNKDAYPIQRHHRQHLRKSWLRLGQRRPFHQPQFHHLIVHIRRVSLETLTLLLSVSQPIFVDSGTHVF